MKKYLNILITVLSVHAFGQVSKSDESYGCTYLEEANYIVNKKTVYFENCYIHRQVDVNPDSLRLVKAGLAFDNKNMFYNGIKLDITPNNPKVITEGNSAIYWVNDDLLYRNEIELYKIDVHTFKYLGHGYFSNKDSMYYYEKLLKNIDLATFVKSYNNYDYDKNSVYHKGNRLEINGNVQAINTHFFRDNTTVYQYNYGYLFNLEPRYDISIQDVKAIPKTEYGIVHDTLYYQNESTNYNHIKRENIKVFSKNTIGFNNIIMYKGFTTEKFDFASVQVLESDSYSCKLKDKNGSYIMESYQSLSIKPAPLHEKYNDDRAITYKRIAPLQMLNGILIRNGYPFVKKALLQKEGMTNFENLELVSILKGYRRGCSQDIQSSSNHYILKNTQGYWKLTKSRKNTISFIGKTYKF